MAHDRIQWRAAVSEIMKLPVPQKEIFPDKLSVY
jgi:hypothetical protein